MSELKPSRRDFLKTAGLGIAGLAMAGPALALPPSRADLGTVKNGKVSFPATKQSSEPPEGETPAPWPAAQRIGIAIVGLGRLALNEILPAFGESKYIRPVALVSGSPEKAKAVAAQYGIAPGAIYDYENFERIKDNPEIQAVYIVLPNSMHRAFTERAAKAGKHVLCEKPMATSAEDARAMIAACKAADVKLMIAYRCQYEVFNRKLIELSRDGTIGDVRFIETNNSQAEKEPDQWRLKKAMAGGGSLPDIGLYCLNTTRAVLGEEPVEVFASTYSDPHDPRFSEVEARISFLLRFASGITALCAAAYHGYASKDITVRGSKGWAKLNGAYAYNGKQMLIGRRSGEVEGVEERHFAEKNHFALEMDHFAQCLVQNCTPRTPGEEGLQDQIIMEALYQSAATGQPVKLDTPKRRDAYRGEGPKEA